MASNDNETALLKINTDLDIADATKRLNSLRGQIGYLTKELNKLSAKGLVEDARKVEDELKRVRSTYERLKATTKDFQIGAASIKDSTKQTRYLEQALEKVKGKLKEINMEARAFQTAMSGTNALYNKAILNGRRLYEQYGTEWGLRLQNARTIRQRRRDEDTILSVENPEAYQAKRLQEGFQNRSQVIGAYQLQIMANYAAINKLVSGYKYLINYTAQYDEQLHQLQAISGVTTGTLKQMRSAIEEVASTTEFTALELSKASTILAQAGLSATQIEGTLPAIAKLATATGTELTTAVETITSTLNIYNLQTSEAEHVTNALTTAMNESKADISGFQQAIQYAGNFASELGMSFDETAAAISAAAQAGIRSKSMLGTGLRATLTEFLKPTKKLQDQLASVGLTIDDINVKTKGYVNVLRTLKNAGFGAEEAFRGMDRRGAAFLVTQIKQVDFMDELRSKMLTSTAAAEANEKQMDALNKQLKNLQNILGNAVSQGLEPFVRMLSNLLKIVNSLLSFRPLQGGIGAILTGLAAGAGVKYLGMVVESLKNMSKFLGIMSGAKTVAGLGSVSKSIVTMSRAFSRFGLGGASIVAFLKFLVSPTVLGTLVGLGSVIYQITDALGLWTTNQEKLNAEFEKAKGEYDETKNKLTGIQGLFERLYSQREKFQEQSERDIFVQEIISKYPEIAKYIDNVTMSYQELIETVQKLNTLAVSEAAENAAKTADALLAREKGDVKRAAEDIDPARLNAFIAGSSFSQMGAFGENLKNITSIYRTKDTQSGWAFSDTRTVGLSLRDTLIKILDDAKATSDKELSKRISELRTEGARSLDEGIKKIIVDVTTRYEAQREAGLRKEIEAQSLAAESTRKTSQTWERTQEILGRVQKDLEDFGESVKDAVPNIKNLSQDYTELSNTLNRMGRIYELSGTERAFSDYSQQDAVSYLGLSFTSELKDQFTKYLSASEDINKKAAADYISGAKTIEEGQSRFNDAFEAYKVDFLQGNEFRNQKMTEITQQMLAIKVAIEKNGLSVPNVGRTAGEVKADIDKLLKTKGNWSKANRGASMTTLEGYTRELAASLLENRLSKYRLEGVNYLGLTSNLSAMKNGTPVSSEELNKQLKTAVKEAFMSNSSYTKEDVDKYLKSEDFSKLGEAFQQHVTNIGGKLKNVGKELENNTGPKFDTAAASLNKFFKDLDADINKVQIAYANAEKALDSLVAKQQGRVTATGLVFGKNSGLVQYEQNRLEDLQDAQLSDRLRNLQEERYGLQQLLTRLERNPEYQDVTSRYNAAEERYDSAIKAGKWNEAREAKKIMDELASANKKYTDEEKKLTTSITDLDKQIDELNTTIKDSEALSKMSGTEQVALGWRSATSNYAKDTERQGLGTIAGSMDYLSTESINALDSSMTTMFQNIADGSKKAGDAFKDFGKQIIQTIRDVAIQMAVKQGITALFGGLFGGSGGPTTPSGIDSSSSAYGQLWGDYAVGGLINGPIKNRDSVPTMLMPGEYVMKKSAVDTLGRDYLDNLNNNASATLNAASESISDAKTSSTDKSIGAGGIVNVYVVGQEQQQSMTPNDVLVTITQDMMKGGQTKTLVKSIAMGAI